MGSRAIRCGHCGSGVTSDELDPAAFCPFCGKPLELAELRGELAGYQAAVGAKLEQIDREHQQAAAWDRWYGDSARKPGKTMAVAYLLMIGVPMLLALGAFLFHRLGSLDLRGPGLSIVIMGASMLGVIAYVVWYYRRGGKTAGPRPAAGAATVACPNCGAPGALTPGQAADSCEYCGGALVPTRTVMQRSLDEVQAAVRRAELERYRTQRQGMANVMAYSGGATRYIPLIAMGPFLLLVVVLPFGWTCAMIGGDEPFNPAVFLAYGLALGGVGGGILFFRHRRRRRRALAGALEALARQHGGRVLAAMNDWVAWLNAYWADEYGVNEIYQGPYGGAVTMDVAGYPTLVVFDAAGQDRYRPRKLHVLLAAWIPGLSDATGTGAALDQNAEQLRRSFGARGFDVTVSKGGLIARALESEVARLARNPAALRELAPVIAAMARLASAVGAAPVQAV